MSATHSSSFTTTPFGARKARRVETIALAIGICLPVPALAATGLSVPLPNVVERIAAALVPWAEPGAVAAGEVPEATRGRIVRVAGDLAPAAAPRVPGAPARSATKAQPTRAAGADAAPLSASPRGRPNTAGGTTSSAPSAPSAPAPIAPTAADDAPPAAPSAGGVPPVTSAAP